MNRTRLFQTLIIILILSINGAVIFSHQTTLLNWFNTDDAFYYFKVAQNIVAGRGVTFDGLAPTNGFHPLWMAVILPIFSLSQYNLILPLRFVIALQTLLSAGAGLIMFNMCRQRASETLSFVVALTWVLIPQVYEIASKGGTEAGLNVFMLTLFWAQLSKVTARFSLSPVKLREIVTLGALAALVVLARLDQIFLVFLAGAWLLIRLWIGTKETFKIFLAAWQRWLKVAVAYFAPLTLTLSLYMLSNKLIFGSEMPVSGKIKRWWGTLKYTAYGKPPTEFEDIWAEIVSTNSNIGPWSALMAPFQSFIDWLRPQITSVHGINYQFANWIISIALVGLLAFLLIRQREFAFSACQHWNIVPLFFGCVIHIAYYKAGGYAAQKSWYWIGETMLIVLLAGILIESVYRQILRPRTLKWAAEGLVLLLAVTLIRPYVGQTADILTYEAPLGEQYYLMRARWLEENTEPGALIGMTGSGSTGYFIQDRVVVNLDGLISSTEYFIHLQNATADEYLASIGLDYVFGNANILQHSNPYLWNFDGHLETYQVFPLKDGAIVLFRFVE